ncbi:TPA: hemerythrin domain-containing protein [Clostridium botulinum]|uniref:Hemerythrin n=1 Tax=Clostridium botulinum TaxID=1491 RepID=A0ABC8D025_CLOBO|nr:MULTISPECIES: hemerythrin domain-containing protein [Clostridium]AVQ40197.1 hemerythrin [Clostridium botulinum]EJE7235608.1 hemerythrin domain-containing protein [Clostridium botulinum]MBO0523937.1 hemerythrin domain-containing protein [Clostridium botulinum]MBO0529454.1 hemerythrin domain-containing protein [Clostridium botulinum]MBO0530809.1 hemerythrin domain-containing protein [Clostridium botulinum]
MNSIELMVNEHKNIKRMLAVIRKYCFKVLKNQQLDYNDFYRIIDFVRNYADKHHHGKEEDYLFNRMIEEIKGPTEKLVKHGMLVEHDLGRLYMQNLEKALKALENGEEEAKIDIIANAVSYTDLLYRHIEKEDDVVYKFAERNLSKESLKKLDEDCKRIEKEAKEKGIQDKYINLIYELEEKVK